MRFWFFGSCHAQLHYYVATTGTANATRMQTLHHISFTAFLNGLLSMNCVQ
jgi:hypothetical protein